MFPAKCGKQGSMNIRKDHEEKAAVIFCAECRQYAGDSGKQNGGQSLPSRRGQIHQEISYILMFLAVVANNRGKKNAERKKGT